MKAKLSKPMKSALISMLDGMENVGSSQTMKALKQRGFVTATSKLSNSGRQAAIAFLPLSRQCTLLGIKYDEIELPTDIKGPEILSYTYFLNQGYSGMCGEGTPLLILIKAAILDFVTDHSTFESRDECCRRYTEAHLQINIDRAAEILKVVGRSKKPIIKRNLKEILEVYESPGLANGITVRSLLELFELIGPSGLAELTQIFLEDPYGYRKGWPDLVLWKDGIIRWIEIKTSDKLHASQIGTIQRFKGTPAGSFELVKVNYISGNR